MYWTNQKVLDAVINLAGEGRSPSGEVSTRASTRASSTGGQRPRRRRGGRPATGSSSGRPATCSSTRRALRRHRRLCRCVSDSGMSVERKDFGNGLPGSLGADAGCVPARSGSALIVFRRRSRRTRSSSCLSSSHSSRSWWASCCCASTTSGCPGCSSRQLSWIPRSAPGTSRHRRHRLALLELTFS